MKGIDYQHFIKLRFLTINNNDIAKYSIYGWKILWYLMINAKDNTYIQFTPNMIMKDLKISKTRVFSAIEKLFKNKVIHGTVNDKNTNKCLSINDIVKIIITYAKDDLFEESQAGFKAIPIDFITRALVDMNEYEWGIYCMLVVRHRYFKVDESVDIETGEVKYYCNIYEYAFPTQLQIAQSLGIDKKTVNTYLKTLEDKQYITHEEYNLDKISKPNAEGEKSIIRNSNYKYHVKLLMRFEYMKYHIVNIGYTKNKYSSKELKLLETKNIDELLLIDYKLINDVKYITERYGADIEEYPNTYCKDEQN